jgi:exosortase/archaeosortase family protein
LAYAYLYKRTIKQRLAVVVLTLPLSIAASILRLTAIFILTYLFGSRMAEHVPHLIISWTIFFTVMMSCISLDHFFHYRSLKAEPQAQNIGFEDKVD